MIISIKQFLNHTQEKACNEGELVPPWKNLLDISKKIWASLRKLFVPTSQAGYGPAQKMK